MLTVSIGAGAPTSGVDVGFINVLSGTTNLSVPVTLNANSTGGTSPISASPNSLSFVFAEGSYGGGNSECSAVQFQLQRHELHCYANHQ